MTLGQKIRAARLRWHHANRHGALIRVSDVAPNRFLFELWPVDELLPGRGTGKEFRDLTGVADEIMNSSPVLAQISGIKKGFDVILGEHGEPS